MWFVWCYVMQQEKVLEDFELVLLLRLTLEDIFVIHGDAIKWHENSNT